MASHEQACARVSSLFPSRWLRHYTGSKLRSDPVFQLAYDLLGNTSEPILDVGCGVGLLAFYLRERGVTQPMIGLDIDQRKIRRAISASTARRYSDLQFVASDASHDLPPSTGNVVLFDLLHYLPPEAQQELLGQLATRVAPGAFLLLRDSPRDGSVRFTATYAAEVFAQTISWNWRTPLHFATIEDISATFRELEFTREIMPASGRTPFNNKLFIFRRLK